MAKKDEDAGFGSIGEVLPTFFVLLAFSFAWGVVQFRDGTPFIGLAVMAPLAAGMLSAAAVRMLLGRGRGGLGVVGGLGGVVFLLAFALAVVAGVAMSPAEAKAGDALGAYQLGIAIGVGFVGSFVGALSLAHYRMSAPQEADEDTSDLPEESPDDDIDYSTEPEELVCLLTNQVVNREHDKYTVCHNKFNQTQVCHAVYLRDYVHLLEGRCRRCFQPLRERDLKGMGAG
jgi:hypothetical protein